MKNLPELAEHIASLCVGAMAMGGAAATGLSAVAVPLAVLGAIGFQLRGSCARRGGLQAARSVTEALARAGELRSEDVERALDLMKSTDVARTIRPFDMAAAARDLPAGADVNALLATPLADSLTEPNDPIHGVLVMALSGAIAVLRQDEDFHRDLTQEFLIEVLKGQGQLTLSQEEIQRKLDSLQRDYHTLAAALKDHQRLRRDEMEAIASRFEIARVYDLSDVQLREQLELRAVDFRRFHDQIEAIDERVRGLGNLKAAARDAAEQLDFAKVEVLLAKVDEVETEIAAETKSLRADNALLRGRPAEAFAILSAAADSFASVNPTEPARRRLKYQQKLFAHGARYGGEGVVLACELIRKAIPLVSKNAEPHLFAEAYNSLGVALATCAQGVPGDVGSKLFIEAAEAYHIALDVWMLDDDLPYWAMAMHNLANLHRACGERLGFYEGIPLFIAAWDACNSVLEVWTNKKYPENFAMCQNTLAGTLALIAERSDPKIGTELFSEAERAWRSTLEVWTRDADPVNWAMVQNNLGNILWNQCTLLPNDAGFGYFDAAIEAFHAALEIRREAVFPVAWAMTLSNLGCALAAYGERREGDDGLVLLREAVSVWQASLRVRTEEAHPVDWAITTANLGRVHEAIARSEKGLKQKKILEDSIEFFVDALRVYDLGALPYDRNGILEALARVRAKLAALPDPA